jgi:probable rRNA maturation factor
MRRARPTTASNLAQRLKLEVSYASRSPWVPNSRLLGKWAAAALMPTTKLPTKPTTTPTPTTKPRPSAKPRVKPAVLSVRIVGEARSRSLNAHYRHKDKPTNVLSFAGAGSAPDGRYYLGELVICAPVVASEARAQGKSLQAHWAHMTIHGVLHLLGYDHERAPAAAKMAFWETQILDRLGFSDPYL